MKPREVIAIFEDFEGDADDELTESEKVKEVLKDVDDKQVRNFWKTLDGYKERDYMMFKGSVLEHYLGTRKTTKYFLEQLRELSDDNKTRRVSLRRLTDYYSRFSPIVLWLEDKEIISPSETDEYFWYGLPKKIQKRILRQPDSKDQMIPPMKRAFKKAHRIVKEMLEEDGEDSFGWPSVMSADVEILIDKEIGEESTQVAGVERELQEFKDSEEILELRVLGDDDDDAQRIPGYVDGAMGSAEEIEVQGSAESELARDGDVREPENMPLPNKRLPTAIEDVPGVLRNLPAAAKIALESDENELAASKDIPAVYNSSPECQASFIHHGTLPEFGDGSATVEDMLATDNDIPAKYNFPEHESILMSCKTLPANGRVVCKTLRIPRDLLKLQIGYRLPLMGFYWPVSPIFAYTKVRKKDGSVYWLLVKGVPWSHIQLSISTGIRKRAIVSVQRRVVFLSNGLVVQDMLIGTLTKMAIFFEMEGEGLAKKQRKRKPSSRRTSKTPYRHIHSFQIIVEKPYDDRSISQTTRGIKNELDKKTFLEAYRYPADHICLEAPEELPNFDNVAINQNTMISQVKTNSAQITYQFSVVTRKRIIASTRHLGRLDDDGNPVIVQRRRRLDNWRSKISKRENVPDFSDHG